MPPIKKKSVAAQPAPPAPKKRGPKPYVRGVTTDRPMTKSKLPKVVVTMRRHCDLTPRKMAFVVEYLRDYDLLRAFKAAGYKTKGKNQRSMAYRLMRDPRIMHMINDEQLKIMQATGIDRENTVQRMHLQYLEARRDGDHGNAIKALVEIGKVLGIYEAHNRQKSNYSPADIERMKKELKEVGFDLKDLDPKSN